MRAALYLRRSKEKQEASIVDQRREVADLAKRRRYKVVMEFVDDGISGDATEKRLGFQQMIQAASRKEFDVVLCWDQDRFGRFDPLEAGYWIKPMRDAGVVLETVAQGRIDWNDFAGRLIYTVTQEGKHAYLRDLARNCNRGVRKRIAEGVWASQPPFGYVHGPDGRLVHAETAKVAAVRRVFALRSQGIGYRSIANIMEKEGHPTPKGSVWDIGNVRYILARESYLGVMIVGKRTSAKYERMFDGVQRFENVHPPIITQAEWTATRPERFRTLKPIRRNGAYSAALAGMLTCGLCGHPMYVHKHMGVLGYVCGTYHRGQGCGFCRVTDVDIRGQIADKIHSRLAAVSLSQIRTALTARLPSRAPVGNARNIAKLDQQIATASERMLLVPASALSAAKRKIDELITLRDRLATEPVSVPRLGEGITVDKVVQLFDTLPDDLRHVAANEARSLFAYFVGSIRCDFEQRPGAKIRRFFNWTGGEMFFTDGSAEPCCMHRPKA